MARIIETSTLTYTDLSRRLRDKRWEGVGSGFYGAAYAKGSLVWKIQANRTRVSR